MGIYDRDYEREPAAGWGGGGGWRPEGAGGFANWSANAKLLAVLVGVWLLQLATLQQATPEQPGLSIATEWLELKSDWFLQPWRAYGLVTYSLLHDTGGVYHLLFNGLALFFFGRSIEARLGGREYLAFFFVGAAFAGLVWSLAEIAAGGLQGGPGLVGASGGIAAVLILFAFCYPNVQVYLMGIVPVPAWLMAVLFVAQDVMGALSRSGNVAYTAHLGGALFGYLYFRNGWRVSEWLPGWLGGAGGGGASLASLLKPRPKLQIHRGDEEDDSGEDRVDEILRKIQAQGQDSLTREERRFLERASKRYQRRRD